MSALAKPRNTPYRTGEDFSRALAAGVKAFHGGIAVLNAAGYSQPGTTSAAVKADGVYQETVDNAAGADGALNVHVRRGHFRFINSAAADQITLADIGNTAYIVDDQTVAKTDGGGTRSPAGVIADVDAKGVWVQFK